MTDRRTQNLKTLFQKNGGIMRMARLREAGVCTQDIRSLLADGHIVRLKTGYYAWRDLLGELSDYEMATATIPNATICFLSAASLYDLTTVIPRVVYVAVPNKGAPPQKPNAPPIDLIQHNPGLFALGRTELMLGAGTLPIYDRERTVCDCLKRSDESGDDVALEVLKNYMRGQRDIPRLYAYAEKLRIRHKLHPYMEALT